MTPADLLSELENKIPQFDPLQEYPGGEKVYVLTPDEMGAVKRHMQELQQRQKCHDSAECLEITPFLVFFIMLAYITLLFSVAPWM